MPLLRPLPLYAALARASRQQRALSVLSLTKSQRPSLRLRLRPVAAGGVLVSGFALALFGASNASVPVPDAPDPSGAPPNATSSSADRSDTTAPSQTLTGVPFNTLLRSYFVYSTLSVPLIVDYAPSVLSFLTSIPVVSGITLSCVRNTFFAQFVGGESALDVVPCMNMLRAQNKLSILTYNVEVDESGGSEAPWRQNMEEVKRSIQVMEQVEGSAPGEGIVAIKLTALIPHVSSLQSFSSYLVSHRAASSVPYPGTPSISDLALLTSPPGSDKVPPELPAKDAEEIRTLYEDLRDVCALAKEKDVKVLIDSEHTWYQPAMDVITLGLQKEFNKSTSWFVPPKPIVYGTCQCYLRRAPEHLQAQLRLARAQSFALGMKLVRGAYHVQETARASEQNLPTPVWSSKSETDACYNACAQVLLQEVGRPQGKLGTAVLFGTHNRESVQKILDGLVEQGLAMKSDATGRMRLKPGTEGRVLIAQLYGMHDDLTDKVARTVLSKSPIAVKCIPYGTLEEVMPYLGRRAIENKSVISGKGGAASERRRYGAEIWRRIKSSVALL